MRSIEKSLFRTAPEFQVVKKTRHACHQWSTRSDPQSRQWRTLFSLEICFVLLYFEKWLRTDGQQLWKQESLPAMTVGRPIGSIKNLREKIDFRGWVEKILGFIHAHQGRKYFFFKHSITFDWIGFENDNNKRAIYRAIKQLLRILIHSADPQSRLVVIIVFTHVVCPSVRPHFSNLGEQNKF